ncbi:L-seryl-tRNA(Sec) selenium transferase [Desulfofundulus thermobenzoicus]|uniref:L-seryl-tRNA(Sec) selenium transferase n=1 Tax=Desulfofundulus thermobenzoicus TaxID=29376 RepID=A0A6N7IR41_9FIRM|nr:L-seryl-tRNA(Sec) selenium transferase [Desulfofundulus thermobenzoicus]MQL52053.1 L-seryl-tRNA(Sec) selenium transferase [Desulfofundulus thermobenzoicus]
MVAQDKTNLLRQLPSVDEILRAPRTAELLEEYPRPLVVEAVREGLDRWRRAILNNEISGEIRREEILPRLAADIGRLVHHRARRNLRRVINATGVVLHTNLGRAVLSPSAREAVQMVAAGYSNLELNLDSGKRGSRYAPLEGLLARLTGAEAAIVVNNNAAAVLLALSTLAREREVIVSRGQLVEIGGSFRIPEVMAQSGAKLVEVGATNKTYPDDFRRVINQETALLLHVHASNYRIIGFTREITIAELVALGKEYNLPVMSDLGSGFLVDLSGCGLPPEPTVQEVVAAGPDVVTFSGDKLLGGPQAGIIVGRRQYIEKMKKNPLTRAIRIDKMTVAALEATLRAYLEPEKAMVEIPTLYMLTTPLEKLEEEARALAEELQKMAGSLAQIAVERTVSRVGGGAMPTADLPSLAVTVWPCQMNSEELAARLRSSEPAVMGRVQEDRLVLDVRTVLPGERGMLARVVAAALDPERKGAE